MRQAADASLPALGPRAVVAALSGLVPAMLAWACLVLLLDRVALVPVRDSVALTLWWAWMLVVPGTVLWRLLDRHEPPDLRSFPVDTVLGSLVGIVTLLPVYLLTVALDVPWVAPAWPLAVAALGFVLRKGGPHPLLLRCEPSPRWWTWGLAAIVVFVALVSVDTWQSLALTPGSYRAPYVDEPYHLSLVAEFRHHVPGETPYVAGTPLRYHWLVYPFIAAISWGTGVDLTVLLRMLVPAALNVTVILGVAVAAARVSGHRWAGLAAAGLMTMTSPLDVMGWTPTARPWIELPWATYFSPTQLLAGALCPLLLVQLVEVVQAPGSGFRVRAWRWVALAATMLAVAGAKSAMLPLFVAGLCGACVMVLLLTRRVPWHLVAAAAVALGVFALATIVFYGTGSRALELGPFQVVDLQAGTLGLVDLGAEAGTFLRTSLLLVAVVMILAQAAGGLGLMTRGGWRTGVPWMLGGASAAGLVALMVVRAPSFTEYYFFRSTSVVTPFIVATGWARAIGAVTRRSVAVVVATTAAGLGIALMVATVTSQDQPLASAGTDTARVLVSFVLPIGLALLGLVLVVLAVYAVGRRRPGPRLVAGAAVSTMVGLCLPFGVGQALSVVRDDPAAPMGNTIIAPGGIQAARWIRNHTDADDVVATNTHDRRPGLTRLGDHRAFWMSGYSERRILVEGWAYIVPEAVGLPSNEETNRSAGVLEFWDQPRLQLNDEVFLRPSATNIAELDRRYGVRWLLLDKASPHAPLGAFRGLATVRSNSPHYAVLELPDPS